MSLDVTFNNVGNTGVRYPADLNTFVTSFVSTGFPYMELDDQIVIVGEADGADTQIFVINGDDITYDMGSHTVAGSVDEVIVATLGDSYQTDGSFALDDEGHIVDYSAIMSFDGIDFFNDSSVRGDTHNLVAELMYLGGGSFRGTETLDMALNQAQNVVGSSGDDTYLGTRFDDTVKGGAGDDVLRGGNGDDVIRGGAGDDVVRGDRGDDRLFGNAGNDTMKGGGGHDRLFGNAGDDKLFGNGGDDTMKGGGGDDDLRGGGGDDNLLGNAGNDVLRGGGGDDKLFGHAGDDKLLGGNGNDLLIGGLGADTIDPGAGDDVIRYRSAAELDGDEIVNFGRGSNTIHLRGFDANTSSRGKDSFVFIGDDDFSGAGGELSVTVVDGDSIVTGDVNGDGVADFEMTVVGYTDLTESDFLL